MKYSITIISLIAGCFIAGCSLLTKPVVTQQPVFAPASTNVVTITNRPEPVIVYISTTNTLHEVATNYVTNTPPAQVITQTVIQPATTNWLNVTNYMPNPAFLSALDTAKTVNQSVNVTPTSAPINLGLSALAGLATLAAAWQNRKSNKATDVVSTIIGAIEKLPPDIANVIKPAVQAAGIKAGVADDIHAAVQAATT